MKCSRLLPLLGALLTGGCAIGYNSTLFMTKSNLGVDFDTKPPTAEVSIARREAVIAPAFEGGQKVPVLASFGSNQNGLSRFLFGVKSTFAGGDAAEALSRSDTGTDYDSKLYLTRKPYPASVFGNDVTIPEKGQVRPFVMGTDTTFGLKLAWSGMTATFPDTLRIGFNRKEFALAPHFGTDEIDRTKHPSATYAVGMPSFLAVLDYDVKAGRPEDTSLNWLQFIATGTAATNLAQREDVRRVMMNRMAPVVFSGIYDSDDPTVACISNWLSGDPGRPAELESWWKSRGLQGWGTILIKTKEHAKERMKYIEEQKIQCTQ